MEQMIDYRVFLLTLAFFATLILGGPLWLHRLLGLDVLPRVWRHALHTLGTRLNRAQRNASTRRVRGLLLLVATVVTAAALGWGIERLTQYRPMFYIAEVALLACLLPVRRLGEEAHAVGLALKAGSLDAAREAAAHLARRDLKSMDSHALCRAAVEHLAENFADRIVAPALWYLIGGLPAALVVCAVNLLDHQFGHRDAQHAAFGVWSARADDILQFIPARVSVIFLLLAAPLVPRTRIGQALASITRDAVRFSSPNSGLPVSCAAGALGVTLAGPRRLHGEVIDDPWTGSGSAKLTLTDLTRGEILYAVASGLLVLCITALNL